jgi:hypothetical protein
MSWRGVERGGNMVSLFCGVVGLVIGCVAGVIFSGRIAAKLESGFTALINTVHQRALAIETAILNAAGKAKV